MNMSLHCTASVDATDVDLHHVNWLTPVIDICVSLGTDALVMLLP